MTISLPLFDVLTPFMLEGGGVRGRMVRLGPVAETVLGRYDYPPHVAKMLGELLLAAAMLSGNLKQEGIFTIQIRGEGLVPLIVVDAVYGGALRGYAEVPPESVAAINALTDYSPHALVGKGAYLAITLDPGMNMERYQGIVSLEGDSIAAALTHYFTASAQLDVAIQLALSHEQNWRAAGIMIERMPETPKLDVAEQWRYATAVTSTLTNEELLDPLLDAPELLYRLYHEEGVWVYDPQPLDIGCRCSRERILGILTGMSLTDRADMVVDGQISVHCQFCNKTELFTPQEIGLSVN